MKYLPALILGFCMYVLARKKANVCKTFLDYYTDRDRNPNCSYNPDIHLSVPQIIQRHGYPLETHKVTTEDGYILTMFRIPHGKHKQNRTIEPPIFIAHGLSVSSMAFVNTGPKSLAFVLANEGYDVWLGNFRGTEYSDKHVNLTKNDLKYWNFSFHEMGIHDVRALLNLIVEKTKQKIFYLGHSMGTTAYFIYAVEYPELAKQRIRIAICWAPVVFLINLYTPLKMFLPYWDIVEPIAQIVQNGHLDERTPEMIAARELACLPDPIKINMCEIPMGLVIGQDVSQEDMETLPVTAMQNIDAYSLKTLTHYIQLYQSKRFQKYDYGTQNQEAYGTAKPPEYNLSLVKVPNYFYRANMDIIATKKNVETTFAALPTDVKPFDIYLVPYRYFAHMDFSSAKDVVELLYDHLIKFLKTEGNRFT